MKKLILGVAVIAMAFVVGCGKNDSKDSTNAYNQYGYNGYGYNGYGPGGAAIGYYRWQGNECVDTRNGRVVNERYCNATGGAGFGGGYGGGYGYGGCSGYSGGFSYGSCGGSSWNYNFVNGFGTGVCAPGFIPVPMAGFNNTVMCVEAGFAPYFSANYGTPFIPSMYQGYGYSMVGCIPGYSSCNCGGASFALGAQFGQGYAGLSAGICIH